MKLTPRLVKIHPYKWTTQAQKIKNNMKIKIQILKRIQTKIKNNLTMMMTNTTWKKSMKKLRTGGKSGNSKKASFQFQSKNGYSKNTSE